MSETDINKWLHEVGIYNGSADTHDCIKIIKIQAEALDSLEIHSGCAMTVDSIAEEAKAKVQGVIDGC